MIKDILVTLLDVIYTPGRDITHIMKRCPIESERSDIVDIEFDWKQK